MPPEIIFDQGLGDLFVIRVAGHLVDDLVLASLEYAAEHLGVPLILVLRHARCGAIEAAIQAHDAPGHLGSLVRSLQRTVESAADEPGDLLSNAVRGHVAAMVRRLRSLEPVLAERVTQGRLEVVGALWGLGTGAVEILPGIM